MKLSIILSIQNRANLFRYALEGLARQDYPAGDLEICIGDYYSNDNLMSLIDRYSEDFTFKYCQIDKNKSYVPMTSYNPAADFNVLIKYVASHPYIIKMDPEIVMRDPWVLAEIAEGLEENDSRMYNARAHFTEGEHWYSNFEDVVNKYERNYHMAEGGPFSRSKFYFCSGFSRERFLEMGGVDEIFCLAVGYDDTCFREHWKNAYGEYEKEITGRVIHLWHPQSNRPPAWEALGSRIYEHIKKRARANTIRVSPDNKLVINNEGHPWGAPEMLSKVYTIRDSAVIDTANPSGRGHDIELPF